MKHRAQSTVHSTQLCQKKWQNYLSLKDKQQPKQEIAGVAFAVAAVEKSSGKWSQITGKVNDSQEKYIKLSGKLCNAHHSSLYIHMYITYTYVHKYIYSIYTQLKT